MFILTDLIQWMIFVNPTGGVRLFMIPREPAKPCRIWSAPHCKENFSIMTLKSNACIYPAFGVRSQRESGSGL